MSSKLLMQDARWAAVLLVALGPVAARGGPGRLPVVDPATVGMDQRQLGYIDGAVAEGIARQQMPGCVVLIGRHGKIAFLKAYGQRALQPRPEPMTTDTVFDLASVTKPVATATSVMILFERGKFRLHDPVARYLPAFGQNGKDRITIAHLLTHQGGLIPDNSENDYRDGPAKAFERIFAQVPTAEPGSRFVYSDLSFLVLGELVHQLAGKSLDGFVQENIFGPLGMTETTYRPGAALRARAAVTEQRDGHWIQGEVHDPRAYRLEGVAGHAGLFSTAQDLAVYAQMLLAGGTYEGVRILGPATVALMTAPEPVSTGLRTLGWDMRTGYSLNRGENFSSRAFGHGGFTGTALWIDPDLDLFVIFLSNRVHPNGKGLVNPLIGRIGSIAAAAIEDQPGTPSPLFAAAPAPAARRETRAVLTGIDVLERTGFAALKGRRVGLITNQTGLTRSGVSTVESLRHAPGVQLVALYSPEHGIAGKLDVSGIADARDAASGLPIYSLYGKNRRPTAESLRGIDTLVFDIQDVGARFYTYISTLGLALETAAAHKLQFVVLDRPNPINGVDVEGPMLDPGKESFVGYHALPVRHGLTVGELARLFNAERKLNADLHVIALEGWRRSDFWDQTGLVWVNPSPNMRSLTQALLYPGIGLLETTNVSVGRGTDTPFEVIGAPWLDGRRLALALDRVGLSGVRFVPIRFTPASSKHAGQRCGGVNIIITDRAGFDPLVTGLTIACQLRALYPKEWDVEGYGRLLGNAAVLAAIRAHKPAPQLLPLYAAGLEQFRERRRAFLLYP